jgi:hypothetical protein
MDFIRWAISPSSTSKRSSLDMYELCDVIRQDLSADIPSEPCYGWLPSLELCHRRPARREPIPCADSDYHGDDELSTSLSYSAARTGYTFDIYASSIAQSPVKASHHDSPISATHLAQSEQCACPYTIESIFQTLRDYPVVCIDKADAVNAWTSTVRPSISGPDPSSLDVICSPIVRSFTETTRTELHSDEGSGIVTDDEAFEIPEWLHKLSATDLQALSLAQEIMPSTTQLDPDLKEYTPERIRKMIAILTARSRSISQLRAFWERQREPTRGGHL